MLPELEVQAIIEDPCRENVLEVAKLARVKRQLGALLKLAKGAEVAGDNEHRMAMQLVEDGQPLVDLVGSVGGSGKYTTATAGMI